VWPDGASDESLDLRRVGVKNEANGRTFTADERTAAASVEGVGTGDEMTPVEVRTRCERQSGHGRTNLGLI
jgi:hypothetical protein